jgi:hypothetical protein
MDKNRIEEFFRDPTLEQPTTDYFAVVLTAKRSECPSTFGHPGRLGCRRNRLEDYSLSTIVEASVMGRISLKIGATGAS